LEHGADASSLAGSERATALHIAASNGSVEIASALLEAGADISFKDKNGMTPLEVAQQFGETRVVELLITRSPKRRGRRWYQLWK
ncbi:MAG: ankyrin repeat domain-containing protein, partial [Thermoanaerobaculia bacterium]